MAFAKKKQSAKHLLRGLLIYENQSRYSMLLRMVRQR